MEAKSTREQDLYRKFIDDTATEAELREFWQSLAKDGETESLQAAVHDLYGALQTVEGKDWSEAEQKIAASISISIGKASRARVHRVHFMLRRGVQLAAAAVLIFGLVGAWLWISSGTKQSLVAKKENKIIKDAAPGKTGAVLILGDGSEVSLDDATNGKLREGIVKKDSTIVYGSTEAVAMNTLRTPNGRSFSATLADGTKVWLNAGSSISYPTAFTDKTREVNIAGEVYFEVAKNAAKPFVVITPADRIEVLGTHFNVNAYSDEGAIKTTLLEGAVKMNNTTLLKPGEQYANGKTKTVNTASVVSWVYGSFSFDGADIQTVMRQISRWYDVEIRYEGKPTTELFGGEILRSLNLSQVLNTMEFTGIHYTLDGKTLVIRP